MQAGYVALCYHYVRSSTEDLEFPGLLGTTLDAFDEQLRKLADVFEVVSPGRATTYSVEGKLSGPDRVGLLITFDDGLQDHYRVAERLAERGIKAWFFIPTCILTENLPANPIIVHYCLSKYRIDGFLGFYREALEAAGLDDSGLGVSFTRGVDDPWATIGRIKELFRYRLDRPTARSVLLHIYEHSILRDHPDALGRMHLTREQIEGMIGMGHAIGSHSCTHISVGATALGPEEVEEEILGPRRFLEQTFDQPIRAMSYPFGGPRDCLSGESLRRMTDAYDLAFTVEERMNTRSRSPLELGRVMPYSTDTSAGLGDKLLKIVAQDGQGAR